MPPAAPTPPSSRRPLPWGRPALALLCRILGHRWHFSHAHPEAGKVYRCGRCGREARFVR